MSLLVSTEDRAYAADLFGLYATTLSERKLKTVLLDLLNLSPEETGTTAREFVNRFILDNYPNETTIKGNFINSVLLPLNASNVSIFELPIGKSRVDICKVNGHSTAYEIKTELDSFYRLENQLEDYFDVFEQVYVITSEERWKNLPSYVPSECGIYSYRQKADGSYAFYCRRKAAMCSETNAEKQLNAMPKKEICDTFGMLSAGKDKKHLIAECLSMFSSQYINKKFKRYLKARYAPNWCYLKQNSKNIYEIDYEWFYRNQLDPQIVY